MGYNRENFRRVKAEYSNKYLVAQNRADRRRAEVYEAVPEVRQIDALLAETCALIVGTFGSGREAAEEKLKEIRRANAELLEARAKLLSENGYPADYTDVKYECELCGDTGYVDTKMCSCMKRALALAGYESSGLGGLIRTQSFDNFSLDYYGDYREKMEVAVSELRDFSESFDSSSYVNFLLTGPTGLGKTHLSTSVAKSVIERGYDVLYVTAVGMISDFEEIRFGNGVSGTERHDTRNYYDTDLLIIDDLGTEIINQFSVSCLYDVINTRINNRKSTFINTNLTGKDFEQKYSDRLVSRIFGEYKAIVFKGNDIRRQKLR